MSFTPEEDLALSRAVSSVALSTEDMLLTVYWDTVARIYNRQTDARMRTTGTSLAVVVPRQTGGRPLSGGRPAQTATLKIS